MEELSDEEAKTTMVKNLDYDENDPDDVENLSIYDLAVGDDFCIIASTEFE